MRTFSFGVTETYSPLQLKYMMRYIIFKSFHRVIFCCTMVVLLAILASHHTELVDNTYILENVAQIVSI